MLIDETVMKTIKVLITSVLFFASLLIAYQLRVVIGWVLIGVFLALVINPAVSKLARRMPGKRRGPAVFIVLAIGAALLAGMLALFIPPLVSQTTELVQTWPEVSSQFTENVQTSPDQPYVFIRESGLQNYAETNQDKIGQVFESFVTVSVTKVFGVLTSLGATFTILTMAIYMSVNGTLYAESAKQRLPKKQAKGLEQLGSQMYRVFTQYVNGNLLTSAIAGAVGGLVCVVVGVPYAAIMGLIIAVTDLIPMVGAIIGATIVVIVSLFVSVQMAVIMTIFFTLYQLLENSWIAPRVMGKTVEMSSFVVFLAALAGGVLAGLLGALVAIPIGACLQILFRYVMKQWRPQVEALE